MFKLNRNLCLVIFVFGCSSGKGSSPTWFDTSLPYDDGASMDDTADEDSSESSATWWRLSASLELVDGEILEEKSSFFAEILEDDRHVLCSLSSVPSTVTAAKELPHETIETWWNITVDTWDDSCGGALGKDPVPLEFQLGLGEMHPEIVAVLDNLVQAESGSEDALSSAFASFDSGESLLVFGTGGTAEQYSGTSPETPELLNGSVYIYPLYPFLIPPD